MHWYGPDRHYWFRAEITVPESFAGRSLWLHVRTQIDEWDDAKNPQFLLFVNDEIVQGMDMNHREVLLTREAKAGERYRLDLQAYTGILHTEFNLIFELREIDPDLEGLYWDLYVPLSAFPRLDPQDTRRMALERDERRGEPAGPAHALFRCLYGHGASGPGIPAKAPV